jgi:hypothetical protein
MRASSLYVQGCAFNEPRSALAHLEGRMPGRRATGVCFLSVTFLCTSTAPQERREQRSWPRSGGGQDAGSQER